MGFNLDEYIRIDEFARLASMSHRSLYMYNHRRLYGFPRPALVIGVVKFYRRADALAWIKRHRR
jgi:predicted DNA-binding transcriptional regulator AlpA